MSEKDIVLRQRQLIDEHRKLIASVSEVSRLVDTDEIDRCRVEGLEKLTYADSENPDEISRLYYRAVLKMWNVAASDLIRILEISPRLRVYRTFFVDRICGCGASSHLARTLRKRLNRLSDGGIGLTMTLDNIREEYHEIVSDSATFFKQLSEQQWRIISAMSAVFGILGLTVGYIISLLIRFVRYAINNFPL